MRSEAQELVKFTHVSLQDDSHLLLGSLRLFLASSIGTLRWSRRVVEPCTR